MTVRVKSAVVRVPLILLAGLVFGVLAAIAGLVYHQVDAAAAATDPQCTNDGSGTETITLNGGTVTLSDFGGSLKVEPETASTNPCGVVGTLSGTVTSMVFAVGGTATQASTVVLNQTDTGKVFPCLPISGPVGNTTTGNGTVDIVGYDGENITVGSTGVNLRAGVCTAGQVGILTNVAAYQLSDNTNSVPTSVTLSAAGDATTGDPANVPVTFIGGATTPLGRHLNNSTFIGGSTTDTYTVFGDGNKFQVGTGTDAITATDTAVPPTNTLDFSRVQTSPSSHLAINVSGTSQTVGTTTVKDGQAALGSIISDTFNSPAFSVIKGAGPGNTDFLGGDHGGLTFTAQGSSGNAADFTGATSGVNVDLTATINNVTNAFPFTTLTAPDTLQNLTTVTGSAAGHNFFVTGSGPSYSFIGNGDFNTFDGFGGSGTDTFISNGTSNQFFPGPGPATFIDPTSGNTVNLDFFNNPALVNVSGTTVNTTLSGTPITSLNDTATTLGGATYTFTALAEPTTFLGSGGPTTFFAGTGADTFRGAGAGPNELSYASAPGGPLTISLVAGHAVLGGVTEPFSNIKTFDSLAGGNTTFVSGGANGNTFNAPAGTPGNTANYTSDGHPVTADLSAGTVSDTGLGAPDTIKGISTVFGSGVAGGNTFVAGPGSETFGDTGSVGGDAVNFTNVSTSLSTLLTVNASASPVNGVNPGTAGAGSAVYTFNNKPGNFTTFAGANTGNTLFLAGTRGGLTFTAQPATTGNAADFSTASSGLTVNLSLLTNNVTGGGLLVPDTLQNLTNVTGSISGGTTFAGGSAGPYTFTGHSSGNTFDAAGSGFASSATFIDPAPGNTVDLSQLTVPQACGGAGQPCATVNVSGVQVNNTLNHTATTGAGATYTFTSLTEPTTFVGSLGGTTFYAGTASDTFTGQGLTADTLSYAFASGGPLTISLVASHAVLGGVTEPFSNIKTFDSLSGGNTTFVSNLVNGNTFRAPTGTTGNTADYSTDPHPVTVDLSAGSVSDTGGGLPDKIKNITTVFGSGVAGGNTFVAGAGSETFGDTGSVGGDTVNFMNVSTSQSNPLTVNASAAPANGVGPATAAAGSAVYTFNNKPGNFAIFDGANTGNTLFLAGTRGGLTFTAQPATAGNSADFSAASSGLNVNLSLLTNNVTGGGLSAADTLQNLTNVTGSLVGGGTFAGGSAGPYTFTAHSSGNTFVAGTGSATFVDLTPGNTVDLSHLVSPATVDVSGVTANSTNNGTATSGGATYTFTQLAEPTTFNGSAGGTTFFAGSAADAFHGVGAGPNELSYHFASGGPLTVCLVLSSPGCTGAPQAVLGGVTQPFSNIHIFDSLLGGSTTFVSGGANSNKFAATGLFNTADYSQDPNPINADLVLGHVSDSSGTDTISGITTVNGSSNGHNNFVAGFTSETFGDAGGVGADSIDFSGVPTSGSAILTVNVSGHPVSGAGDSTAVVTTTTYSFTNNGDFTRFTGANTGWTRFDAPGTPGGYAFTAPLNSISNTADFSRTSGIVADMTNGQVTGPTPADTLSGAFLQQGSNTVVGSSSGANTFYGNLVGSQFTAQNLGKANTVSYLHLTSVPAVTFDLSAQQISGGPAVDSYTFPSSAGLTAQGSPGADTFVVGTTLAAIQGGGGDDSLDVGNAPGQSPGPTGVTVDLNAGKVTAPNSTIVATFSPGCGLAPATDLCVTAVTGSTFNDTFIANSRALSGAVPPVTLTGNGGTDGLNLSAITTTAATICMPIVGSSPLGLPPCSTTGFVGSGVSQPPTGTRGVTFTGISNVTGTQSGIQGGGDYVYDGTGSSKFTESGNSATLDFSNLPLPSAVQPNIPGVTVTTSNPLGSQQGTATSPFLSISDTFAGFGNFIGTQGNDSFTQFDPGTYTFSGGLGVNSLDLSGAPANATVDVHGSPAGECSSGLPQFTTTDGFTSYTSPPTTPSDTFSCISNFVAPPSTIFMASPGTTVNQAAKLNGGGTGTLKLVNDLSGGGATINLVKDWVTGDGYMFQFSGMSTIVGTPFNDTFIPGSSNVDLIGGGGQDGLSFLAGTVPGTSPPVAFNGAPAGVDVNLSDSSYSVPAGMPNAGTTVPACTAIGGFGGTISMADPNTGACTVSNVTGTASFPDALVGGSGTDTLAGGAGADRFVLSNGGRTTIVGGTGASTLDLSSLTGGITTFALSDPTVQPLPNSGSVQVISGNITTVMASPGGSNLSAGFGNGITLMGGPGNDILAAGTGNQTLVGGGGNDTLIGGLGNDVLQGGNQPVTFQPGEGTDTLLSPVAGNTLSYAAATTGIQANLSTQLVQVPPGKPFANDVLQPQTVTGGFPGSTVDLSGASINHLIGTPLTDLFVTSGSNDNISGGGANDLFILLNGNNTVSEPAGSNADFLIDGAGSNIINGGGSGTLDFSEVPATGIGVFVNLQTGTATGGFPGAGTQHFSGISTVFGTDQNFSDKLVASGPGQIIVGQGTGSDLLQAGPSGGDTLIGGNGNTTFCSASNCKVSNTSTGGGATAATENHMFGGSGEDTFFVRNSAFDFIDGGGGIFNSAQVDAIDTAVNIQTFLP